MDSLYNLVVLLKWFHSPFFTISRHPASLSLHACPTWTVSSFNPTTNLWDKPVSSAVGHDGCDRPMSTATPARNQATDAVEERKNVLRLLLVGEIIRRFDSRAPFQYYLEIPSRAGRSQLKMEFLWRSSPGASGFFIRVDLLLWRNFWKFNIKRIQNCWFESPGA